MSRTSDRTERVNTWIDRHGEKIYWVLLLLPVWLGLADRRERQRRRDP